MDIHLHFRCERVDFAQDSKKKGSVNALTIICSSTYACMSRTSNLHSLSSLAFCVAHLHNRFESTP
jgi:hypothetical protein